MPAALPDIPGPAAHTPLLPSKSPKALSPSPAIAPHRSLHVPPLPLPSHANIAPPDSLFDSAPHSSTPPLHIPPQSLPASSLPLPRFSPLCSFPSHPPSSSHSPPLPSAAALLPLTSVTPISGAPEPLRDSPAVAPNAPPTALS